MSCAAFTFPLASTSVVGRKRKASSASTSDGNALHSPHMRVQWGLIKTAPRLRPCPDGENSRWPGGYRHHIGCTSALCCRATSRSSSSQYKNSSGKRRQSHDYRLLSAVSWIDQYASPTRCKHESTSSIFDRPFARTCIGAGLKRGAMVVPSLALPLPEQKVCAGLDVGNRHPPARRIGGDSYRNVELLVLHSRL